jgi:hypothetical protein
MCRRAAGRSATLNARAKENALTEFDREFDSLRSMLRTLQPDALETPVFTGEGEGWHVRDLIPHLAAWQGRAALAARKLAAEHRRPGRDERLRAILGLDASADALNQATFERWRQRDVREQLTELGNVHQEMMGALNALSPDQLMDGEDTESVFVCFRMPGLEHLRMHRVHIEAALKKEGTKT